MTTIQIQVKGLKELNEYMIKLPKKVEQQIMEVGDKFAGLVQKSAKLRAGSGHAWGYLADSIKVTKDNKKISVIADAPEAQFVEFGFRGHTIYPNMTDRHGNTLAERGFEAPVFASGRAKPFMAPALEIGLNRLPNMLQDAMNKAIGKAK